MTLLVGALTIGLILSLLALGVYISFRIFHFPDITADGSITFGAAILRGEMAARAVAVLLLSNYAFKFLAALVEPILGFCRDFKYRHLGMNLAYDVDAVFTLFYHPLYPANLTLDPV